jgi:hypothetical protein
MMKIYFERFTCLEDVAKEFCVPYEDIKDLDILYAAYDCSPYEGYAHVIYVKDKKIYEVNGSHCSCNGLEGMWEPEETSLTALLFRPNVSDYAKANIKSRYKNLLAFL